MSQIDKLLTRLVRTPAPRDFTWQQLVKVMTHFGYEELEGSGSRKKFVNLRTKHKVLLHKRHPDSTLIGPQIEDIIDALKSQGYIS
jgi:hypothetical protein